jgi:hypothetical protein
MPKDKTPDPEAARAEAEAFLEGVKAEAAPPAELTVEMDGQSFTLLSPDEEWPLTATLAIGRVAAAQAGDMAAIGHMADFCEALMGRDQWIAFERFPGRKSSDMNRLFDRVLVAYGLRSGE